MKDKGTKTRYPGVYRIDARTHRITAKFLDPRTREERWFQRLLNGVSAQQAAAERKRLITEAKQGLNGSGKQVKIGDYAKSWLESKALHVDVATVERYSQALKHALDAFGELYADALRTTDVQKWIDAEIRAGYSPMTIRGWYSTIRTMLCDAVAELELPRDPTLRVRLPEAIEEEENANSFTLDELPRFLAIVREQCPQHYAVIATLAFTGLRFCHVSPLRWADVDLDANRLTIRRKQVRGIIGPVSRKKRAPRVYPLPRELAAILKWHRAHFPGLPRAWVFPDRNGNLRRAPSSLYKAWSTCLKAAGIDRRVTVHGLRRTFTDLARRAGVDSVVARSLTGHVTERMREHYSTVGEDEKRRAVTSVLRLVGDAEASDQEVGPEVGPDPKSENAPSDQPG